MCFAYASYVLYYNDNIDNKFIANINFGRIKY